MRTTHHMLRRALLRRQPSPSQSHHHFHTSSPSHLPRSFPATFCRGGTSNGLVILRSHLPADPSKWPSILAPAMGSPDPYGRQLNGMGSGISSTSKVCVIGPSERDDADVDFTFVQVGVKDGGLDVAGNCGNMSSVVGPVAVDEGLVVVKGVEEAGRKEVVVRIWNTNTKKIIHSRFRVDEQGRFDPMGDYEMTGVPGTGSRITLSFLRPAGAGTGKGASPTGNAVDELVLPDGRRVEASLVDVSNPGVFVRGRDLMGGKYGPDTTPAEVEGDASLKGLLESIRRAGAEKMGLNPEVQSVPKVVVVFDPPEGDGVDIRCLAMSMGQAHKAVPLTLALCLGSAAGIEGTIPHQLRSGGGEEKKSEEQGPRSTTVVIGHPSGKVEIGTTVEDGEVVSAELHRTARVLMKGEVFY
ncbi:PrpF protein [Coniochaeta sp. 2T2.1]|nr:PrpF protein [Coniochaeta sp. 2T2.1]